MTAACRLTGLVAAPYTPFDDRGELQLDRIEPYARFLAAAGLDGVFVCGTTGEGAALTTEEHRAVAGRWVRVAGGKFPVVVNVAHTSAREAGSLAAHAAEVGAAAVACTAPFYFRPGGVADLVAFLAEVASAAPRLPFYYYDIPATTGVLLPAAEVLRRAAEAIPNFAGIKFSNPDLLALQECVAASEGRLDVLFGIDEYLLAALSLGATGAVGSTYNYASLIYRKVIEGVRCGDLIAARASQLQAARMVRVLIEYGGLRAGKAAMKFAGVDCGPVRPPLRPLTRDEERALARRLSTELPELFSAAHFIGE